MFKRISSALFFALFFALISCGGGGGSSDADVSGDGNVSSVAVTPETPAPIETAPVPNLQPQVVSVKGMGVKGPLINAVVRAYRVDPAGQNLKGDLLAVGSTDNNAALQLEIAVSDLAEGLILIDYSGGRELDGSVPVIDSLRAVATVGQIINEVPIFATPLTTLVIDYVEVGGLLVDSSEAEILRLLALAADATKAAFSFGVMSAELDLFTSSPVLSAETNQQDSLAYRSSIEAFSAIVELMHEETIVQNAEATGEQIVQAIAADMLDGSFDGLNCGEEISTLGAVENNLLTEILCINPSTLPIPGTTTLIADLNKTMEGELARIAPSVLVDVGLEIGSLVSVEPNFQGGVSELPTPAPVPEPTPAPVPEPTPAPVPEPTSAPVPESTPAPAPEPTPVPDPESAPAPVPITKIITLSWQAPSIRENGDSLIASELGGYKIIYFQDGADAGSELLIDIAAKDSTGMLRTSFDIVITHAGLWHFSIACYDTDGLIGVYSDLISDDIQL